jgi:hypothetical protein
MSPIILDGSSGTYSRIGSERHTFCMYGILKLEESQNEHKDTAL